VKILTYPVNLELGGSAINAIDLASGLVDRGHEVIFYAPHGPLASILIDRGLRHIVANVPARPRPSPRAIRQIWRIVRQEQVDLVHSYEYWTCVEAFFGAHLAAGVPQIASVMSMGGVPAYFPRSIPMIVGTHALQVENARQRQGSVERLEPPINTVDDHPSSVDPSAFLRRFGIQEPGTNIVVVSRLCPDLKLEGLASAIDAAGILAARRHVRLIIVGGGSAYESLAASAERTNIRTGYEVVVLTGPMLDPRPAYAGADVVLGMGSSVLRGMAFQKPAIVLGEDGFVELVTPTTLGRFLQDGFYGKGTGPAALTLDLQIERLVDDPLLREQLGWFGRALVCSRFGLDGAVSVLEDVCVRAVSQRPTVGRVLPEAIQVGVRAAKHKIRDRWAARSIRRTAAA
jgi:L-malate glycosyltransferase